MLTRRTDLADETHALWRASAGEESALPGVRAREDRREGFPVTRVDILDREGAQALGKPEGHYITLGLEELLRREEDAFPRAVRALAGELNELLKDLPPRAPVLVAGLGNRAITPDAVGPRVADLTLVTRHLIHSVPEHFAAYRPVSALAPGVLGSTGIESAELLSALSETVRPACVLAVDALAARSLRRVCRTVQLSDTGIVPGSGVGNHRRALNRESLGIPVVAVGVPTVVDAATLCADVLEEAGQGAYTPESLSGSGQGVIVTPREIDQDVEDLSRTVAFGINLALHPQLTLSDLELLLG